MRLLVMEASQDAYALSQYADMGVQFVSIHCGLGERNVKRPLRVVGPNEISDDALEMGQGSSIRGLGFHAIKGFGNEFLPRRLLP